ncbi:enkurin domain-containing protein 1 [Biomphalaria pfeifferi]|uniref:Enkurin domain-containing protein 1 n=1 Tax=Biomphalaria pfeifferi TaxID=112525 RepID=A0AAD8AWM6_BIOPF|nr:enkurin domain-containing protein 1 [Biomphalaria pfeifferi]
MRSNFDFKTKNQLNENVRRLREIQRNCKKRQEEKQEPVKVLWKSEKYSCVESKIKQDIEKPLESRPVTPDITNKTSVPPASTAQNVTLIRHNWDFIKVNGINAKRASLNRPHSLTALDDSKKRQEDLLNNYHFGEVPSYLQKRKQEWRHEEDQRIANTPDPSMPPGHRQLPENERKETLELLLAKQRDVVTHIQKLPIGADTIRVKQQRQSLEKQLTEVEEAIKIFSRPKVFVRVES